MAIAWIHTDTAHFAFDNTPPRTVTEYDVNMVIVGQRPYTPEEEAAADAEAMIPVIEQNARSIADALDAYLPELQTIIDTSNANLKTAFLDNPGTILKLFARVLRRIIRLLIRRLDSTT